MSLQNWDEKKFTSNYEKIVKKAQNKAGNKIGKAVEKKSKAALGRVKPERKKMITSKVAKNGTLVIKDRASDARSREYGATINAKPGTAITVFFDKKDRGPGDFIAESGGERFLFKEKNGTAKPIAVLKKTIVKREVAKTKKISEFAKEAFPDYINEIDKHIEGTL